MALSNPILLFDIPENSAVNADAAAALTKLLANPSMAELIKNLAKNL